MFKHILVPVDGSSTSNAALRQAFIFAQEQAAAVHLVSVFDPIIHAGERSIIDLAATMRQLAETIIEEARQTADKAGVPVTTAVLNSHNRRIAIVIAEEAATSGADLIIMGTHGRRGVEHLIVGSVAEGVVRRAGMPVLLVRAK